MSAEWFSNYLTGQCYDCYRYLGAHPVTTSQGKTGYFFRLYAPMAKNVTLIGEFNNWERERNPMRKVDEFGLWEGFVEGAKQWQKYSYLVWGQDNIERRKTDPVSFLTERRPGTDSVLYDLENYKFNDEAWMKKRDRNFDRPMSVYEVHLGSWHSDSNNAPRYEDMAQPLIKYCHDMGYTHVELMPLTAYPFDGSWGYQATGYFAADARYGEPNGLKRLIDELHQADIGVILDMVPVHFATDPFGLEKFDGSNLYEYYGDMEFSQWGSKNFDLSKDPVRSFLISSSDMFLSLYHIDGLRFDAVSNIIYYGGETNRGVNPTGTYFARHLNQALHARHGQIMTIAEDSSAFPDVSKGFKQEGLQFDYKWDMGWMNDTLKYYAKDPIYKSWSHRDIVFSMAYFYSENYILPLSHDEVVHGKGTILNKMWGDYDQKFALARNLYAYQYGHPGKKLNFMGNEIGDFDEWDEKKGLPWNLLSYPKHEGLQRLVRDLNKIYTHHPAMYLNEYSPDAFQWIMVDDSAQSVLVFKRQAGDETMVFVFNMTPNYYGYYDIGVPLPGEWAEILNSDKGVYGGYDQYNGMTLKTSDAYLQGQPYRVTLKLAPFGALYLMHINEKNAKDQEIIDSTSRAPEETVEEQINKDVKIISSKRRSGT